MTPGQRHRPETRARIAASLAATFARRRACAGREGWTQPGSLAQRVRGLIVAGYDNAALYAAEPDVSRAVLRAYASHYRRQLRVPVLRVTLDAATLDALQLEAADRDTPAAVLIARAMAALADDPELLERLLTQGPEETGT